MTNNEKNQYYALQLWDPALPGFCSGSKTYYGMEDTLTALAEKMIAEDKYADTGKAILDYFNGNKDAKHSVASNEGRYITGADIRIDGGMSLK